MAINKVEYGGNTLIDLTSDSVTPESLLPGVTAHDKSGNQITGTFDSDKYLEKTGDASNATVTFTQATNRANISSKEKLSVIMGKIAKFFSDLKTVAFTGKYSDLSGTPGVVSKTANGLCPKNGGTTTKFLRDDGTYAEPTASVSGLSTLEQVTAAATAGNVTDPVGAGAVNELNSSLGIDTKLIDGVPYWSERGADTWNPFSSGFNGADIYMSGTNSGNLSKIELASKGQYFYGFDYDDSTKKFTVLYDGTYSYMLSTTSSYTSLYINDKLIEYATKNGQATIYNTIELKKGDTGYISSNNAGQFAQGYLRRIV